MYEKPFIIKKYRITQQDEFIKKDKDNSNIDIEVKNENILKLSDYIMIKKNLKREKLNKISWIQPKDIKSKSTQTYNLSKKPIIRCLNYPNSIYKVYLEAWKNYNN